MSKKPNRGASFAGLTLATMVGIVVLSTTAQGCGPQPEAESPAPRYPTDLASHMSELFIAAVDLETAVIRGRVEEGNQHARWLATHELHRDLPGASGPYATAVQAAADDAAEANDLPTLAHASARMASACGSCHAATRGDDLRHLPGPPPDDSEVLASRMARHVWAADRMWEALSEHSPELWITGAEVLGTSAIAAREASWNPRVVAEVTPYVDEVEQISQAALAPLDWPERAELLGALLVTCSGCHDKVGLDPLGRAGIGGPSQ